MAAQQLLVKTQVRYGLRLEVPGGLEVVDATQYDTEAVYEAKDAKTKKRVSVAKLTDVFESLETVKRTVRELRLLRLCKHANVMAVNGIFFDDTSLMRSMFVVRNTVDCDLAHLISSSEPIPGEYAAFVLYHIMKGMKYVHSAHVIHGGLQPEVIHLSENGGVTISGFGLNRFASAERWTCTGTGAWYCAPEVIGGDARTLAMDVWPIACIYAEMLVERPLFRGRGTFHHLVLVCELLGVPTVEELAVVSKLLPPESIPHLMSTPGPPGGAWEALQSRLPGVGNEELELLSLMLTWHPSDRKDVNFLIEHPLMEGWRDPENEPTREPVHSSHFRFEAATSLHDLRAEILVEALHCHPEDLSKHASELEADLGVISSIRKLSSSMRVVVDRAALNYGLVDFAPLAAVALLLLVQGSCQ